MRRDDLERQMKLTKIVLTLAIALGALGAVPAYAVNTVTQLSGTLSVTRPDGSIKLLSQKSEVLPGDTLATQRDSYAQVRLGDGGLMTLKPNTQARIDSIVFEEASPEKDSVVFGLLKGGLRMVSGLIGKRGNKDAYSLRTATATIGIRGTAFGADDCTDPATPCVNPDSKQTLPSGVYVNVTEGEILVTNSQGSESFNAGKFGLIALNKRPISIPENASVPPFVAPPQFGGSGSNSQECVVR
jgi:hypothetical protein